MLIDHNPIRFAVFGFKIAKTFTHQNISTLEKERNMGDIRICLILFYFKIVEKPLPTDNSSANVFLKFFSFNNLLYWCPCDTIHSDPLRFWAKFLETFTVLYFP